VHMDHARAPWLLSAPLLDALGDRKGRVNV
jgi:hypothetical protein